MGGDAQSCSLVDHSSGRGARPAAQTEGTSARESNKLLGQTGRPFWQDESYDRLVRNANEFQRIESYPKPGASRAGSIGRGIPMVEYLEAGRAEARCRLKPAPHIS